MKNLKDIIFEKLKITNSNNMSGYCSFEWFLLVITGLYYDYKIDYIDEDKVTTYNLVNNFALYNVYKNCFNLNHKDFYNFIQNNKKKDIFVQLDQNKTGKYKYKLVAKLDKFNYEHDWNNENIIYTLLNKEEINN